VVYHHVGKGTLADKPLAINPDFGVPAKQLPPRPAWDLVLKDPTEKLLNRTEPLWNVTTWPMLYFNGGPSCNVVMTPNISGIRLPDNFADTTAVRGLGDNC
jgi:hypothetical protein